MTDYQPLNKLPIIEEIEGLKEKLDSLRPLPSDIEGRVFQKLRIDWNYHSNAIEGNQLTRGETYQLIMQGITAKGKSLKDHLDITGHQEAIDFMFELIKDFQGLTEVDIKSINQLLLGDKPFQNLAKTSEGLEVMRTITPGKYKKHPNHVLTKTGEIHYYADPLDVTIKMKELIDFVNSEIDKDELHPLVLSALLHHKFVAIHPFDDGNGRTTRILMNLLLIKYGFPIIVIQNENKNEYYDCLSVADKGNYIEFINYLGDNLKKSLTTYLKAANGEDITEPKDLEKEVTLFLKSQVPQKKINNDFKNTIFKIYEFLIRDLKQRLQIFDESFTQIEIIPTRKSDDWSNLPIKTSEPNLIEKLKQVNTEIDNYHIGFFIYLKNSQKVKFEDLYHFVFQINMEVDKIIIKFYRNITYSDPIFYFENEIKMKDFENINKLNLPDEIIKSIFQELKSNTTE